MNYQKTLDYFFERLPMFQRIGATAYKANLDNTIAICKLLNNPENKFKSIHIAGTNGKGSTSHMLASVLQSSGLKVGLYTSPHLKDFRERIKINGKMIPQQNVIDFVNKYIQQLAEEQIQPSFFEMTVGLAFDYFANEKVDIAVIEVGLGGRLDSTNVITPEISVITNISYDHTALLGNTIEKIAIEKAGIIKINIPVVIGETQTETKSIFIQIAKEKNAPIIFADKSSFEYKNIETDLLGMYQQKNIKTVLASIDVLKKKGFQISDKAICDGLKNVVKQTGLLGRWQILSQNPLCIADTGHNEAGIKEVVHQISQIPHQQLHFVIGMVNDKDISEILRLLPENAIYYFCKAKIPRALDAEDLKNQALVFGLKGNIYSSVAEAFSSAKQNADEKDLIFIGGSTFVVAEVL